MKRYTRNSIFLATLAFVCFNCLSMQAQEKDLGGQAWKIWLDEEASWQEDILYLPGSFSLDTLAVNPPTCGWNEVYSSGKDATLPAVVEEFFSGGDARWTYHGVSWFTTEVDVPADWKGKVIRLCVGKKNRRLEVYVNEKLAGYDLVYAAPYACDISDFLVPGEKNRLALRITNPGGSRGWGDFPMTKWGEYLLPPGRDFGGVGAEVKLLLSDPVYLEDVFVQNLRPAGEKHVKVDLSLQNLAEQGEAELEVQILEGDAVLHSESKSLDSLHYGQNSAVFHFSVPEAELWDVGKPNLYTCRARVSSGDFSHEFTREFGFRVFEVLENEEGHQNFYLNGKRFRHRSAIDWSMYAHHGFYPSLQMAELSVGNALAIGHNGINFHRHMADEILLETADNMGLVALEEPGGFLPEININGKNWDEGPSFESQLMEERCLRMARRDRHHPSVAGYIMTNEREEFDILRKNIMLDMHTLDNSKLIVNQSGGHPGGPAGQIPHLRPYDKKFRLDYFDDHTVGAEERFMEYEFSEHQGPVDINKPWKFGRIDPMAHDNIIYWGEVRCYAGPDNWFAIDDQTVQLQDGRTGYDYLNSEKLADKTAAYFKRNRLGEMEGFALQSPEELSVQAGRGLMYTNGRLGQILMANNSADGYAINGWSGGSSVLPEGWGSNLEWYSAMVDEGRNLKGPAEDLAYWVRPLQVAIFRSNGKYFEAGDTIRVKVDLINEGVLDAGSYDYEIKVRDGSGKQTAYGHTGIVEVKGGDCYAQSLEKELAIVVDPAWHAGYLTLEGKLSLAGKELASGLEQVLLKNRSSYKSELGTSSIKVVQWPAAGKALEDVGIHPSEMSGTSGNMVILAGEVPGKRQVKSLLRDVEAGARMVIRFDSLWADLLHEADILSAPVTDWGGHQVGHWIGNGWGFIHELAGSQSRPAENTIGTNAWEIPGDPHGFAPFESAHPQTSYGAWFARHDTLLTLFGEITYGKGSILLAPSYPVDEDHAFSDLLFFNMILR